MRQGGNSAGVRLRLVGTAVLTGIVLLLMPAVAHAQKAASPKRILAIFWSSKDHPGNVAYDASFRAVLQSSPDWIEYYTEHLDSDRFPGEAQLLSLRDYLRQKYADHTIDVVMALGDPPLDFLLKNRDDLFPKAAIVFIANNAPTAQQLAAGSGLTGFVILNSYRKTLNLALALHPRTEQVFIVSGTLTHDKTFENACRRECEDYESRATINYLTDLPPDELTVKLKSLPERSLILYIWQQAKNEQGKLFESQDIFDLVARSASAPIYGLASWQVGRGIVGGYVRIGELIGSRAAEIALQIADGARAQDIPVENIPIEPIFDWRELKRWGISEDLLPPGSIVRFRVPSFWDEYKGYVIFLISVVIVQSLLIAGLVINRARRKRTEGVLREVQESLTIALEASRMGTWDLDLVRDFSGHRSLRHDQIFGYDVPQTDWGREIARRHIVKEDWEIFDAAFARAVLTGGLDFEARVRWPDGSIHWIAARGHFYFDENGQPTRGAGVNFDITERKRAEAALVEQEAKLAGIVGSAMDAIISIDENQRIVLFNAAAQKMFGCAESEVIGQSLDRLIPERFRESHQRYIRAFADTNETKRPMGLLGASGRRTDGEEFPIEASISQLNLHGRKFYTVILRDITKRKRAETQLIESEARFRNMADTAPVLIWVSGPDKLCNYFNKQWLDFTGRTLEQELGNGWADGVHPDDYERCLETYNSAFDRHESFQMEYRLRRADGQFRWIYYSGAPRLSTDGKFLGYIGSCIDITERKTAEQALMDLSGQLIRAREDECARIARELHDDLNQRVALISLELDMLSQNPPQSQARLRELAQGIIQQTAELSTGIHRMSHDLHPSKLVHLGLVAALKSLCVELAQGYGLKIEFAHADMPAALSQDISLCLYRIVQESLNNIVKHSAAKDAQVELRGSEQELRLRISDSGSGFNVESARSKKGLGLISMRERLRLVGGTISIASRISKGTIIDVRVPLGQMGVSHEGLSPNDKGQAAGGG